MTLTSGYIVMVTDDHELTSYALSGDATIGATGALTIANDAITSAKILNSNVTYAKIQNVSATDIILGRSSVGAGVIEEIACTAAGRALIDDATAAAQVTTLGLTIGTNTQAWSARLDEIAALSPADSTFIVGNGSAWVAETGATVRTSLGLAIGTNVQAWSARLDDIAALTPTDSYLLVGNGSTWVEETGATLRTSLGLAIGTNVQAYDAELAALAGLTSAADKLPYFTGSGTAAVTAFTAAGRALVDDATAAAQATTLGLGTASTPTFASLTLTNNLTLTSHAPTTTAGDLYNDSGQQAIGAFTNGLAGWFPRLIYSSYADVTHSGAVTDESLFCASAKGTRTLPENFWIVGKTVHVYLTGHYTTDVGAGNATITVKLGATTFRTTGSVALDNSVTDGHWELDFYITCQSTGGSGTVQGGVSWIHTITTGGATILHETPMTTHAAVVVDTTASMAVDVEWTADDAGTEMEVHTAQVWVEC